MSLSGRVVVVTGAAQGMGAAQAAACAAEGAAVVALDVQPGPDVRAHDVTSEKDWARLHHDLATEFGIVHGLVNNAGITHRARLLDVAVADVQRVARGEPFGPLLGIQALAPLMSAGGAVVNIGSPPGSPLTTPVAIPHSKWALRGLPSSPRWSSGPSASGQHDSSGLHRDTLTASASTRLP